MLRLQKQEPIWPCTHMQRDWGHAPPEKFEFLIARECYGIPILTIFSVFIYMGNVKYMYKMYVGIQFDNGFALLSTYKFAHNIIFENILHIFYIAHIYINTETIVSIGIPPSASKPSGCSSFVASFEGTQPTWMPPSPFHCTGMRQ